MQARHTAQPTADSARGGYTRPNLAAMASSFETGARLVPQAAPRGQDPGGALQTKFSYLHATVAKSQGARRKRGNGPRRTLPRPGSPFFFFRPQCTLCLLVHPLRLSSLRALLLDLLELLDLVELLPKRTAYDAVGLAPARCRLPRGGARVGTRWAHAQGGRKRAAGATGLGARCPSPLRGLGPCCRPQCQFPAAARARGWQPQIRAPCPGGC